MGHISLGGSTYWGKITKYSVNDNFGSIIDCKTELELDDDAAYVNWGASWRMPSYDQLDELRANCTWAWTTRNGINGSVVTGPNGNSIFLPTSGYRSDSTLSSVEYSGFYWSYTLNAGGCLNAYFLYFDLGEVRWYHGYRHQGRSVRPVRVSQ